MENKQCQTDIYSLSIMTERNQALAATVYRPKNEVKKRLCSRQQRVSSASFITILPLT